MDYEGVAAEQKCVCINVPLNLLSTFSKAATNTLFEALKPVEAFVGKILRKHRLERVTRVLLFPPMWPSGAFGPSLGAADEEGRRCLEMNGCNVFCLLFPSEIIVQDLTISSYIPIFFEFETFLTCHINVCRLVEPTLRLIMYQ